MRGRPNLTPQPKGKSTAEMEEEENRGNREGRNPRLEVPAPEKGTVGGGEQA